MTTDTDTAEALEAAIDNLRRVDRQSYASGGVESVWPARKALLAAIAADRARAVAEAVDLDAIALAADLIGRHLAPTSDVARGAVARLEAMLAGRNHNLFCGHVHVFRKYLRNGTSYYQLATTGGGSWLVVWLSPASARSRRLSRS